MCTRRGRLVITERVAHKNRATDLEFYPLHSLSCCEAGDDDGSAGALVPAYTEQLSPEQAQGPSDPSLRRSIEDPNRRRGGGQTLGPKQPSADER